MSKTILITGAAGFIGSHLAGRLLASGYRVLGLDNFDPFYSRRCKEENIREITSDPNFEFIEGNAGAGADLDHFSAVPDAVIHLAASAGVQPSLRTPDLYIENNILNTNRLLEWMRRTQVRKLLFASSSSVYGNNSQVPFTEDSKTCEPVSPYACTKKACELMNYTYHRLYGMDVINLRFFTVYGERQRPDLAIHKFVDRILKKKPVHLYGDGSTARDYTYQADIIKGVHAALEYVLLQQQLFETINLGNHQPVNLKQLVATIEQVLGVAAQVIYEEKKPGDVDFTCADISKARNLLGYHPATSLAAGISAFVHWYQHSMCRQDGNQPPD